MGSDRKYWFVEGMAHPCWVTYNAPWSDGSTVLVAHNKDADTDMGDLFDDEFATLFPQAREITEEQYRGEELIPPPESLLETSHHTPDKGAPYTEKSYKVPGFSAAVIVGDPESFVVYVDRLSTFYPEEIRKIADALKELADWMDRTA